MRILREVETGRVVIAQIERADTAWKRAVGLLGRKSLPGGTALWLEPCNGIHTLAMRFPLDVLFLDKQGTAIRLAASVRPWRICGPVRGARVVVEMPAGTIDTMGITKGNRYHLDETGSPSAAAVK